ncbi:testis-expressed protein 264-like [Asterias amurensis]|uniref:testis-expressed protein 264-like n=1 Tax=Asterias amurensis TaxID=7602 RepID=UPI003AB1B0FA
MASLFVIGIIGLLIAIAVTVFFLLVASGLFHEIEVGTKKSPISKLRIAYKFARGSYSNAGSLFTEVTKLSPEGRCLGVYYDDPKRVPSGSLRYIVGTVLSEGDQEPDKELEKGLMDEGFSVAELPEVSHMVYTTFPYITTLSIYIAVYRVYSALEDYVMANDLCAYPFIELYDGGSIHFMAPLSKQKDFYVPETGGVEIGELSAGELDTGDETDEQPKSISQEDNDESLLKTRPSGEDSTNSDSSFEQLDPPSN